MIRMYSGHADGWTRAELQSAIVSKDIHLMPGWYPNWSARKMSTSDRKMKFAMS